MSNIVTGEDGWWKFKNRIFWEREHPEWRKKRPLGPVSFDMKCPECHFMLENIDPYNKSTIQIMIDHYVDNHLLFKVLELHGYVYEGLGI